MSQIGIYKSGSLQGIELNENLKNIFGKLIHLNEILHNNTEWYGKKLNFKFRNTLIIRNRTILLSKVIL